VAGVLLFALDLWTGSVRLSFAQVWDALAGAEGGDDTAWYIVRNFRLPKALTAVLSGAALGASGLQMQTLFRNPLAGPYVLGVSSGASLGVALFLLGAPLLATLPAGVGAVVRSVGIVGAAWVGAGAIFLLVAAISRRIKDIMAILIVGMMLGSVAGAVVEVLQYFSAEGAVKSFVVWTMGSLGGVTVAQLAVLAPVGLLALGLSVAVIKPLDGLMLGEAYARSMGVRVGRVRMVVFTSTTLLAGTVTAFCGPIGFLGLAVPHIARMLSGEARHKVLMPASMVLGSVVMLGCDIVSGVVGSTPLPINTVTALVGIPVIILVVVRGWK
jgi:iron complex transport system permease protein